MFAIVDANIGFTCSLKGTIASAYINHIEAVKALADCRNSGTWAPKHFYEILNNNLPTVEFYSITKSQYRSVSYKAISNFEDRIYFNHWRRSKMSKEQSQKTIELLGHNIDKFCKEAGVIPVFFPYPVDRTMDVATDYLSDYNKHKTK